MHAMRKNLGIIAMLIVIGIAATGGAIGDRLFGYSLLDKWWPRAEEQLQLPGSTTQTILKEENVVIDVAEKVSPSVVTVGINKTQLFRQADPFDFFGSPFGNRGQVQQRKIEQDIGTGFVISADGLIATNKHVVSDTDAKYRVVTKDNKTFEVQRIFRDPTNDLAILKIEASGLTPAQLGDSDKLKVGQFVMAIGTALGEFRHTVTTGVVSGLGRGITAGGPFGGEAEQLDNVIQTDAAINPGNSGGPLLNSAGQVIGVNTAVSAEGQNIGFAIPINVIKEAIENFNKTGQFSRPYVGVQYQMIDQRTAIMNDVPAGAYIQDVVADSPAEKAGLQADDIITKFDGKKLDDTNTLAKAIAGKKVGDQVEVEYWREGETKTVRVTLEEAK